ncbi:hypothetical protein C2845_PM03G22210 [Panicum miliaceum]|uniref:Uncharacterized protein n=1 Tax=Panicum miliaceum TaxID=4540 RepID=A0A3L6TA85_PANMI|nr:hypothetical protein C2845_PM03G22210 [Panicum miliaceum]
MSFRGLFDLNSAPLGALAVPDADCLTLSLFEEQDLLMAPSVMESQQVRDQALPSVHSVSGGQQVLGSNSAPPAAATLQAESGGVTVPTTDTTADAVDVEDGVEVLSTPQEPFVSMSFNNSDVARDYYNSYARHTGFSIRIDTSRESKRAGEKTKYIYVCQKAGVNKKEKVADDGPITEKKIVRQRRRDYVDRMHCPARMIVRKIAPGQWDVVHFEKEHNHDRLRKFSLTKYLKSHRDIPAEENEFIKLLHVYCITTTRAYQIMAKLYGSIENCPYTEGDAKNLRVEYHAKYKGKDVKATLEYFEELKKEDPDFYYNYTLDEFDRVENLFWVDGAARKSYELYTDCLSFDTTYMINAYNMPCAPFIGIDINGITIQLGCGFLRNEKTEAFVWLFGEFKKVMGSKDPENIITD